jgi:large subunit ribosomal protein L31e
MPRTKEKKPKEKKDRLSPLTQECTINLHKRLHGVTFKKRTPKAVRAIREFAQKVMGTKDVRIEVSLNQFLWSRGIRNTPRRVRVRLSRRRNEDEDAKEPMYTLVSHVPVPPGEYKGLVTKTITE